MNFHLPQFHTNIYNGNIITFLTVGYLLVSQARLFLWRMCLEGAPRQKKRVWPTRPTHHLDWPLQWPHQWGLLHVIKDGECASTVHTTSCRAHGVVDHCACSNHTDRAWLACWTILVPVSVDFIWCHLWSEVLCSVILWGEPERVTCRTWSSCMHPKVITICSTFH